jgi:acyl-CoA synthetase (AMP-forming)/AMP-acid ligase II
MGSGAVRTFGQLEERSRRLAGALAAGGLGPEDRVAVVMTNELATLDVAWALQRSGVHYTLVNTHLTADEAAYIVNDCGAGLLFVSAGLGELAGALAERTPGVTTRVAAGGPLPGHRDLEEMVAAGRPRPAEAEFEGSAMLYSSGTTGRPKGIRRPLTGAPFGTRNPLAGLMDGLLGVGPGDVYLSPAPLYHSAPLTWSMSAHRLGATSVVMERFDPERCLDLMGDQGVTHAQFVPTMFVRLLKLDPGIRQRARLDTLRAVVHAAAPCPVEAKRRMIEWWGPILHEYYSGTEGGGMTWVTSEQWLAHPGSVGPAVWGEVHVCDDQGIELGPGETGVVWFGGRPNDFVYNNDEQKTAETFDPRGWSTLWDVGHLDEDGFLYLTDRKLFMIVSGGVNIYPQEVEDALILHPEVADVAVFGVPDAEMGEAVKAVVQPADGVEPGPALAHRLLAYAREHLARYKCPRSVDFVEALPRGENGKLYKRALRDPYWASRP